MADWPHVICLEGSIVTLSDADKLSVLASLPSEPLAALLVARLRSQGIRAEMSGVLTSGFRADARGGVQVLVLPEDAARAREVLAASHKHGS